MTDLRVKLSEIDPVDLKGLCKTCVEMKTVESEEKKNKEDFDMKVMLRRATPIEIIQMLPQSPAFTKLRSNASNYQKAMKTIKKELGNIPYISRVIKSICCSSQCLLIDMPEN